MVKSETDSPEGGAGTGAQYLFYAREVVRMLAARAEAVVFERLLPRRRERARADAPEVTAESLPTRVTTPRPGLDAPSPAPP